jgi:outer membrane lipoprotein-sorting protein
MNRRGFLAALGALPAFAQDARAIVAESIQRSRADSQRYEGVLEVIDPKRKVSTKRWIYERKGAAGSAKAVLRFTEPAEVKGVALLIVNHPDRASDQWMWTPAVQRERRIAFQDRKTRFFGTDFTFEDLEERDADRAEYKLLGEETIDGVAAWKIQSIPKSDARSQYSKLILWIAKPDYTVRRVDGYDGDALLRRMLYSNYEKVQGVPTARRLEIQDEKRGSRTVMTLDKLQYNVPLLDESFTLQALRRES